jgi:hypothetical protein
LYLFNINAYSCGAAINNAPHSRTMRFTKRTDPENDPRLTCHAPPQFEKV